MLRTLSRSLRGGKQFDLFLERSENAGALERSSCYFGSWVGLCRHNHTARFCTVRQRRHQKHSQLVAAHQSCFCPSLGNGLTLSPRSSVLQQQRWFASSSGDSDKQTEEVNKFIKSIINERETQEAGATKKTSEPTAREDAETQNEKKGAPFGASLLCCALTIAGDMVLWGGGGGHSDFLSTQVFAPSPFGWKYGSVLERMMRTQKLGVRGLLVRFKDAYKTYGKAMVGVHVVTSCCWFGSFYFAAAQGLDVVPLLEWVGTSEKVIQAFKLPGVGNAAVAYLCYKLATPARYTVTLVGTQQLVKYMRRWGYWEPIKPEDSIRSLMREGRENVKDRVDDVKDKVKDRVDDVKDLMKDRVDDVRDKVKDRIDDVKGDVKGKFTGIKGEFKDAYSGWKDKNLENLKGDATDVKDQMTGAWGDYVKKVEERHKLRKK